MEKLLVSLENVKPLSRPQCAEDPDYQWGDGYAPDSQLWNGNGYEPCYPIDPNRNPSKWPTNRDWRNPGFMPWSQATATPMPGGFSAVFRIDPADTNWPDPADDGANVRLYPEQSPDISTDQLRFNVFGIGGGEIKIDCSYRTQQQATEERPSGSLTLRSTARTFPLPNPIRCWQGDTLTFQTFQQYVGPNKYFGPMLFENLTEYDCNQGRCDRCKAVTFDLEVPDLGIAYDAVGGETIEQINGLRMGYAVAQPSGVCRWFQSRFVDYETGFFQPGGLPELMEAFVFADFQYFNVTNLGVLNLKYGARLNRQNDLRCDLNPDSGVCQWFADNWGLEVSQVGTGGWIHEGEYTQVIPANQNCATLPFQIGLGSSKLFETGPPVGGPYPDDLNIIVI